MALSGLSAGLQAQNLPITPGQKATATQVAETGVPLADLAPNAPDSYSVKRGDTLWAISRLFLKSPWRWPELWGMNLQDIRNPHRIYPGQQLYLEKVNGRARLRTRQAAAGGPPTETVRISPRTRSETLADASIPTLAANIIEPFLSEAMIVDEASFAVSPRIVAAQEGRVMLSRGDRAYARGEYASATADTRPLSTEKGNPLDFRVFRNATPLKDPTTQQILGYEAQYVGRAELVHGESIVQIDGKGTNWRGKAFQDIAWRNLKDAGFPDRIAWMRAAAATRPWMDLTRVGIYGGSAGGQNALAGLLHHGDFYKVGVTDCGCHDNRMDKIWWNEAWMNEVGPWYAENSNVTHAAKLTGKLLLIVGEVDTNVDPASTMQVANALIKADKDFELLVMPSTNHGSAETPYASRRRMDFFVRHLHGVEPRR